METTEPAGPLLKAVEFLEKGEWQSAHEIVQGEKSNLAAWLHGIVHTLEGDLDNARYWYLRAGRDFPGAEGVQREIASARRRVFSESACIRFRRAIRSHIKESHGRVRSAPPAETSPKFSCLFVIPLMNPSHRATRGT